MSVRPSPSIVSSEVARFEALGDKWWDPEGPISPLHRINPIRIGWARDLIVRRFKLRRGSARRSPGSTSSTSAAAPGSLREPLTAASAPACTRRRPGPCAQHRRRPRPRRGDRGGAAEIDRLKKFSGSTTEGVISEAFKDLLKAWAKRGDLVFVPQYEFLSPQKNRIRPDGTILHDLRVPFGYWEAKDEETTSTRKSRKNSPRAIRRTTSFSKIPDRGSDPEPTGSHALRRCDGYRKRSTRLLELFFALRAAGNRRIPQGGGAVPDRPAGRARSAARDDRDGAGDNAPFAPRRQISQTRAGNDQSRGHAEPMCGKC